MYKDFPRPKREVLEELGMPPYDPTVAEVMMKTLKPKHQKDPVIIEFIKLYMEHRDHKVAAKMLGLSGWDGRALINRSDIAKCIHELTEQAYHKFGLDPEQIVETVKSIAFFDPIDLENKDGTYKKSLSRLDPLIRKAIKKLKVKNYYEEDENGVKTLKGEIIEYEFWDKMKGLEMLGNEKKLFKQTTVVESEIGSNMRDLLLASSAKADSASAAIDVTPMPIPDKFKGLIE